MAKQAYRMEFVADELLEVLVGLHKEVPSARVAVLTEVSQGGHPEVLVELDEQELEAFAEWYGVELEELEELYAA